MTHRLYMDVHMPAAVTAGLRLRGVDVLTSQDDHMDEAEDDALLDRATTLGRVLVTHDKDFLVISSQRQQAGHEFAGIVAIRQVGVGIGVMVSDLQLIAECTAEDELANRLTHLPL